MKYVIIGTGPAAVSAAKTLSKEDSSSEIVMVSAEAKPFYIKPALVEYISGDVPDNALFMENMIKSDNVSVIAGKRVIKVEADKNSILLATGEKIDYNYLVIATGASSQVPSNLEHARQYIDCLSDSADALRIRKKIETSKKAVISGEGYTGIELARGLKKAGLDVTYITKENELLPGFGEEIDNNALFSKMKERGIDILLEEEINDVVSLSADELNVITSGGKEINCNIVVSSDRYEPNVAFLRDSEISVEKGILVSEELRSSVSNIFSAGDAAQVYDINRNLNRINFGWNSASAQGELCAKNILGEGSVYIADEDKYFRQLIGKKIMERW
ncbi:MAG: FAD-dependent oxidoreductase [Candidatus Schekmanbacteria bacterium]|nr:MAG: FAD-dependent oxidoreductase [Candidatus Schekmanbacteria bacterium]